MTPVTFGYTLHNGMSNDSAFGRQVYLSCLILLEYRENKMRFGATSGTRLPACLLSKLVMGSMLTAL